MIEAPRARALGESGDERQGGTLERLGEEALGLARRYSEDGGAQALPSIRALPQLAHEKRDTHQRRRADQHDADRGLGCLFGELDQAIAPIIERVQAPFQPRSHCFGALFERAPSITVHGLTHFAH
jgi:hypothetical protein